MNHMKKTLAALTIGSSLLVASAGAFAQDAMYKVTITNITAGQVFSPVLVVSHWKDVSLFELGAPASEPLAMLAPTLPARNRALNMRENNWKSERWKLSDLLSTSDQ